MARSVSSLQDLGDLMKKVSNVDDDIFAILSNASSSTKAKDKARKQLAGTVDYTYQSLKESPSLCFVGTNAEYKDYCRNFAAFLLISDPQDEMYRLVFLKLNEILQLITPSFKTELRALRREFMGEKAYVRELGYNWDDLKRPFIADRFVNSYLKTVISVTAEPEIVYIEKEVEKVVVKEVEKIVEKKVEVEKVVEKVVEKTAQNYFGKEGQNVEFKPSWIGEYGGRQLSWHICKAVCAFLNADGGTLYIGVLNNGYASPKELNGFLAGIHNDIRILSGARRLPYGKNDVDSYCLFLKKAITDIFRDGNDVSKFSGNIIVSEAENDNVVKVEVKPSRYCVVKLNGIAYQRSGASSPEMDDRQIEMRMQDLNSVSKVTLFQLEIRRAIKEKKQVIFYAYKSTNSSTISDRYVEPVNFVCENESVICFDTVKAATRQFKLSRIGDVKVLDTPWEYEELHEDINADIFGWTDHGGRFGICFDLKLPAYTYMLEQYPNANKNSFKKLGSGLWRLETTVNSLEPAKGFYLSMADNITIQETKDSEMLKGMIKSFVMDNIINKLN